MAHQSAVTRMPFTEARGMTAAVLALPQLVTVQAAAARVGRESQEGVEPGATGTVHCPTLPAGSRTRSLS